MTDILLLIGTALCVLSVPMAVIALARTEAPRAAAAALVLGLVAIFFAAWADPTPFRVQDVGAAWSRLASGEIRLVSPR